MIHENSLQARVTSKKVDEGDDSDGGEKAEKKKKAIKSKKLKESDQKKKEKHKRDERHHHEAHSSSDAELEQLINCITVSAEYAATKKYRSNEKQLRQVMDNKQSAEFQAVMTLLNLLTPK